ncbi:MAG: hypothetical protein WCB20_06855, partial [Chthoniobacterales bacterium]
PVINAAVVLRGELTVTTDKGRVLHVKAGHPMVEVVDEWHYGANHGTEPVVLIAFYAGVKGTPITVPQKQPLEAGRDDSSAYRFRSDAIGDNF